MHLPILQHPHPVLRMKCSPVVDFGEARTIIGRMVAAVNAPFLPRKAIGLAANQVGITKRVIIVLQGAQWIAMVNPRLVRAEGEQTIRDACMSVELGVSFKVRTRPAFIQVEYQDEIGNECRRKAKGVHAACIAHEIDHLDGKLYFDEQEAP